MMRVFVLLLAALLAPSAAAIDVELVPVGDPGNPCDPQPNGCFGAVDDRFEIGRYEVTNAEYAAFLNSVATPDDAFDLYKGQPGIDYPRAPVGALRFYEVVPGFGNRPVSFVTFYDALRFANWLHNGQPVGPQGPATTEDGAYRITIDAIAGNEFPRQPGALWFLPSENEWHKAAYYDPTVSGYWAYPTRSDVAPTCAGPDSAPNRANCDGAFGGISAVGAYPNSPGPYGTFDQGGNVFEWHESETGVGGGQFRGIRGGAFNQGVDELAASSRGVQSGPDSLANLGFRVARAAPEPSAGLCAGATVLALGASASRRLRRPRRRSSNPADLCCSAQARPHCVREDEASVATVTP